MAEHGATTMELVEVKAEDIIAERQAFYGSFMTLSTVAISLTVVVLVLLWIFVV
jgi:hypothetical protein